mgnify:CR=1 FL=1
MAKPTTQVLLKELKAVEYIPWRETLEIVVERIVTPLGIMKSTGTAVPHTKKSAYLKR